MGIAGRLALIVLFAGTSLAGARAQQGQDDDRPAARERDAQPAERDADRAARLIELGARFLLSAEEREGGWSRESGPGVTALVVRALAQTRSVGPRHAAVRRGIDAALAMQRDDGGVYGAEGLLRNYESSVVLGMLATVDPQAHEARIARLQKFLIDNQWDESEDVSLDNPWYGGAGYGRGKRPDLSNTQIMLEALHDSGLPKDHPAYERALTFIARCQMLGERNDQPFARGSTQGGFIYSPAGGGESKAGEIEIGGRRELRAYGTMTYAGFKSLLYCGLERDDPRVRAALDWITQY